MQISLIVRTLVLLFLLLGHLLFHGHQLPKKTAFSYISAVFVAIRFSFSASCHIFKKKPMSRSSLIELRQLPLLIYF